MSEELLYFLLFFLLFALGGVIIYAIVLRIKLWFYQNIINSVREFLPVRNNSEYPSQQANPSGCGLNLILGFLFFLALFAVFAGWL